MSDTPETDTAIIYRCGQYAPIVFQDFARSLERRLTAMTRERDKARAMLKVSRDALELIASKDYIAAIAAVIARDAIKALDQIGKEANE
jgi:hypothetical protein